MITRFAAVVPDESRIGSYSPLRADCVEKKFNLTFSKGVLTKLEVSNPSEIIGCISIPIDIAKAIVSIPGELLTFKVKQITADKDHISAQTGLLQAQIALINAQKQAGAQ